jgi:uncharacterized membrane protein YobD (UPF0266 family)
MRKYFANQVAKTQNIKRVDLVEKDLLLQPIDEKEFFIFLEKLQSDLKTIIEKITE